MVKVAPLGRPVLPEVNRIRTGPVRPIRGRRRRHNPARGTRELAHDERRQPGRGPGAAMLFWPTSAEALLRDQQPWLGGRHEHAQLLGRHPVVERDEIAPCRAQAKQQVKQLGTVWPEVRHAVPSRDAMCVVVRPPPLPRPARARRSAIRALRSEARPCSGVQLAQCAIQPEIFTPTCSQSPTRFTPRPEP